MSKGRNTHASCMTFTALKHWAILQTELCTTVSTDGSDRSIKIPDILSGLAKPKKSSQGQSIAN